MTTSTRSSLHHAEEGRTTRSGGVASLVELVASDERLLREAVEILKDSAASMGLLFLRPSPADTLKVAPLTLFPNTVPKAALDEIIQIQCDINLLMHHVAHDRELLNSALDGAATVDPFIRNLLDIYRQVDLTAQWELGLIRSDYILSENFSGKTTSVSYRQVEVNMIASGLAGMGARTRLVHDRVLDVLGSDLTAESPPGTEETLTLYGEAMRMAYDVYCREVVRDDRQQLPVMLTVIHDGFESSIMDHRLLEFRAGVRTIRRSFREIAETARVDEKGRLFVGDREVAVVYYRTGYSPDQYTTRDWEMRLLIEQSKAIKCPSVPHQLAGFKKIQQILSRTDVLQRLIPEEKVISRMQMTFVGQWDISEKDSEDRIEGALKGPEKYVLKPNREGGGNNFYGQDLVTKIKEVRNTIHAKEYILMELIQPVLQENYLVRPGLPPERVQTISEVGVFGAILAKSGQVVLNKSAKEVLVRSKASGVREGGVSMGLACISSLVAI